MNKIWILVIGLMTVFLVVFYFIKKPKYEPSVTSSIKTTQTTPMITVISSAFKSGQNIPTKYTCDGEDINPPLTIEGVPAGAKSLVLIVDDPDAPVGTWNHWLVWNMDPVTKEISQDSVPAGAVFGTNDFGKLEYGGPCPPGGTHRYFFRLYALDTRIDLPQGAKRGGLESAMKNHIIDQGELMGKYSR